MTAETLTSARAASGVQPFKTHGDGLVCCAYGTYEVLANVEAGDIFEMCKVPAGAVILAAFLYADDIDEGTEVLDMDVGWADNGGSGTYDGVDVDGLGDLGAWLGDASTLPNIFNQVGTMMVLPSPHFGAGDLPYFTRETMIQIKAVTAANSFTAGAMTVVVLYVVDESKVA